MRATGPGTGIVCQASQLDDRRRQIAQTHGLADDAPRVPARREDEKERHADLGPIEALPVLEQLVIPKLLAVVGSDDDQRAIHWPAPAELDEEPPQPPVEIRQAVFVGIEDQVGEVLVEMELVDLAPVLDEKQEIELRARARPEPNRRPLGRQVGRVGVVVVEEGEVGAAAAAAAVQPAEERVVDRTGVLAVGCHEPSEDRMIPAHPGREARPDCGVPGELPEDGRPQRAEVRQVEGVVLVMGETGGQPRIVGAILDIGHEAGRLVAPRGEVLGQRRERGAERGLPANPELRGQRPVKKLACDGSVQGADDRASSKRMPRVASRCRTGLVGLS